MVNVRVFYKHTAAHGHRPVYAKRVCCTASPRLLPARLLLSWLDSLRLAWHRRGGYRMGDFHSPRHRRRASGAITGLCLPGACRDVHFLSADICALIIQTERTQAPGGANHRRCNSYRGGVPWLVYPVSGCPSSDVRRYGY